MARRNAPAAVEYNTLVAFTAACAAQRINGAYIKADENLYNQDGEFVRTDVYANKNLMKMILKGDFEPTDADVEMARQVIKFCKSVTFKMIQGKTLSDFEQTMYIIAEKETVSSNYDLAVISSIPASFLRNDVRRAIETRIRDASGNLITTADGRVNLSVEVLRCFYSDNWNTYYVTAITPQDQVVFFAYRQKIEVGTNLKIAGTVKGHRDGNTQLNRVKVL
jgi:hypothetical protein